MITGQAAEDLFVEVMKKNNHEVVKATDRENMHEHIDFFVDGVSYDVKGEKSYSRDNEIYKVIWIEKTNVRGNRGWLYGRANLIAFLVPPWFWIISRLALVTFIESHMKDAKTLSHKKKWNWYRRRGRSDEVTYLDFEDIKPLVTKIYKIDGTEVRKVGNGDRSQQ